MSDQTVTYFRGDSYAMELTIIDRALGTAVDISGNTFTMTVDSLQSPESPSSTEKFTVAGIITSGPEGKVSFTPTTSNNNLDPGPYYYDVQMVDGATIRTIIKDSYIITQDITKG